MTDFKFKTKPYEHQLDALMASHDKDEYALFMEMGCGKSKVVIDNFASLYATAKIYNVLIVAPKGVYDNWYSKEIPIHLPDHIPYDMVKWQRNNPKNEKKKIIKIRISPHITEKYSQVRQ